MSRKLIVNADDLGLCRGVNEGISQAHRHGILTSASLMATGPCFEHAVEVVIPENPRLGIGAHLCLTSGRSVLGHRQIPALVHRDGTFRHGFLSLMRLVHSGGAEVLQQITREFDAQLGKIQSAGIVIDHVNSHRHIHMIPAVLHLLTCQMERYGRPVIRVSTEPWFPQSLRRLTSRLPQFLINVPKNLVLHGLCSRHTDRDRALRVDRVYGILGSGRMDGRSLQATISYLPGGVSEILTHPASCVDESLDGMAASDRAFVTSPNRQRERDALTDTATCSAIAAAEVRLISFRDISSSPITRNDDRSTVNN